MAMSIQKQVFWLQVAINYLLGVKILESQSDLGGVELCDRVRKSLDFNLAWLVQVKIRQPTCDFLNRENNSPPSMKSITM